MYDARAFAGAGVSSLGNLEFESVGNQRTLLEGRELWFACEHGKQLALDGQVLQYTPFYICECPNGISGPDSDFVDVDIGSRLSCVN